MQNNNAGQLKKTKSKTTMLHKFVDRFTKKKKRSKSISSPSASRERSADTSRGKRMSRSPSKARTTSAAPAPAPAIQSAYYDVMEVTAKGLKVKKEEKEKKVTPKKKEDRPPAKSPSMIMINAKESQMDVVVHNQKVEKAVKVLLEIMEKGDFKTLKKTLTDDFEPIKHCKVDPDKCTVFNKNLDLCQTNDQELFDANRVLAGESDVFYHGSIVTIPNVTAKVVLAQLPLKDDMQSKEAFWLMVAAHKMQRVFVICDAGEIEKKTMSEYFPDDYIEHKTIRVNNRKTVHRNDEQMNDMLYYEVVPKDCAEAPFAMMEICDFWPDGRVPLNPNRAANTAGCVFESDIDPDATIGVVSMFGAGRAGSFIVAALAIDKLRSGEPPVIKDLAMTLRSQRPGAIETLSQYTFIHIIALTYTLKCFTNPTLKAKIEKLISQLESFVFEQLAEEEDEDESETQEN